MGIIYHRLWYNPKIVITTSKSEKLLSLVPVDDFEKHYSQNISEDHYFGFPLEPILLAEQRLFDRSQRSIAYFSMEYGLSSNTYQPFLSTVPISEKNFSSDHHIFSNMRAMDYYLSVNAGHRLDLPIYSGGLGVLAGDTLKSAADRKLSLVAVGILWNKGYFKQNFWFKNGQIPEETDWDPSTFPGLVPLKTRVEVPIKKETIHLKLWKYYVYGFEKKSVVPLVLLDSNLPENSEPIRKLTGQLYKSDNAEWRLLQRLVLGIGGMRALEKIGYATDTYHLNEGHAALAFIEKARGCADAKVGELKKHFNYTCHTPVAAGHDRFQKKLVQDILRDEDAGLLNKFGQDSHHSDLVNLTELAMSTCDHVNAVAEKHGEVTRLQFPHYKDKIVAITNGVHAPTWVSDSMAALFKGCPTLKNWAKDPSCLQNILNLKEDDGFRRELWAAHQVNKKNLCSVLKNWKMSPDILTVCWARRIASYKRPSLILQDAQRLLEISKKIGPIQVVFAGKAHPKDDLGFTYVNDMMSAIDSLEKESGRLRILMLENYDTYFGKLLSSSVDVWLNNPLPPFEASGTSGMKAILNGVLQLSTLDGWVVEAADKNIGWIFGWEHHGDQVGDEHNLRLREDSSLLYEMLEKVATLYYQTVPPAGGNGLPNTSSDWITKMICAIAAGSFFNTDRMVSDYEKKIWGI